MNQKKTSNTKRISFLCDPTVYEYIKASMEEVGHPRYNFQINFLLDMVFELSRYSDVAEDEFRDWLRKYKAAKTGKPSPQESDNRDQAKVIPLFR